MMFIAALPFSMLIIIVLVLQKRLYACLFLSAGTTIPAAGMTNQGTILTKVLVPFFLLSHLELSTWAQTRTCTGDGPCSCVMSDGSGRVDISSIGNSDGTARLVVTIKSFSIRVGSWSTYSEIVEQPQ